MSLEIEEYHIQVDNRIQLGLRKLTCGGCGEVFFISAGGEIFETVADYAEKKVKSWAARLRTYERDCPGRRTATQERIFWTAVFRDEEAKAGG